MKTLRNLSFLLWVATFIYASSPRLIADGAAYNCYDYGYGNVRCYFDNGVGERSCAQMDTDCDAFCDDWAANSGYTAECSYAYLSCDSGGGDPPNSGYCAYQIYPGSQQMPPGGGCQSGIFCPATCSPAGWSCNNDFGCCAYLSCNWSTNTCEDSICGGDGAPCTNNSECCSNTCESNNRLP